MTPRLIPALVLAPLAFLSPLLAQDRPNRPNDPRRVEPQQAQRDGQLSANERERLIRAVRELRQQVDALQEKVDQMGRGGPRGEGDRRGSERGQQRRGQRGGMVVGRASPMGGPMVMRGRAMLRGGMGAMPRGAMEMGRALMQRGGMMRMGGAMRGQPMRPGVMPMQRGWLQMGEGPEPRNGRGGRGPQGGRPQEGGPARRRGPDGPRMDGPEIEVEDVRVWMQGPDGLPGGQPMFLRQLMQGGDAGGEDLPEPIRVMMQRRGQPGGEGAGQLRERIRQRVLEKVEEAVEAPVVEGEARPTRRPARRKA